jgi:hypothetical protein
VTFDPWRFIYETLFLPKKSEYDLIFSSLSSSEASDMMQDWQHQARRKPLVSSLERCLPRGIARVSTPPKKENRD